MYTHTSDNVHTLTQTLAWFTYDAGAASTARLEPLGVYATNKAFHTHRRSLASSNRTL